MADGASPNKLSIVVFSGDFDKVHYALVLASGAAAVGTPVTLFFTMHAAKALMGKDGWKNLRLSDGDGTGADLDRTFKERQIGTFEDLLEACVAMGVKFMVCEMGLKALGFDRAEIRDDVPIHMGGVVTFLGDASNDGAMLFV